MASDSKNGTGTDAENAAESETEEGEYAPDEIPDPLMEQYLHFADSALEASSRRVNTNRFLGTVLTGVLALLTIFSSGINTNTEFAGVGLVGIAGSALSFYWWQTIKSYQQLNSAKYKIITKIEGDIMPIEPYSDEWKYLQHDQGEPKLIDSPENERDHPSQTKVERKLIGAIGIGYIGVFLFGIYGILVNFGIVPEVLNVFG
jgi:hypothetical protein